MPQDAGGRLPGGCSASGVGNLDETMLSHQGPAAMAEKLVIGKREKALLISPLWVFPEADLILP